MTQTPAPRPRALVVIDVQDGFDDAAYWGPSANPDAETNVKALLGHWAVHRPGPIVVVRHDAAAAASPLHPAQPGNRLKTFIDPDAADLLVAKNVNSAFYGDPDLHTWLTAEGVSELVICGIQTNMCVETTARMAGNLGYRVTVALDATRTFDLTTQLPDGEVTQKAADLMRVTALNLQAGRFATITTTADLLSTPHDND
jgi:nicotinamidase-related amidase